MSLFPRPRIFLGIKSVMGEEQPAPLMDPKDPGYLLAACRYLVHQWQLQADALEAQANKLDRADDGQWVDDRAETVLRYRVGVHCFRREAWMLRCAMAGRMEDAALGRLTYPTPPERT